ncbi:MAG TPA: threonine ammonia-lyase [Methanoregula sp.]|nr:threonine ammonia-lyase [Methanoregula sp.]
MRKRGELRFHSTILIISHNPFSFMVSLEDIRIAKKRISGTIIRTPLVYSPALSALTGANVWLKLETLQKAGSFKVRGAANRILSAKETIKNRGVVAASAGNHAQGVVVAAHAAGVPAVIVMPEWVGVSKQEATKGYGAEVIIHGKTLEESISRAEELAAGGRLFIHPFDDDEVIAGQGTIALEILADLPETDLIVVPVGGGGLIAGIAVAAKGMRPAISVVGVQASVCPSAVEALRQERPVQVTAGRTIADGIRVAATGNRTFPIISQLVDQIVLVTEEEIADAMLLLLERKHIVAEGAGAAPLAALLNGSIPVRAGSNVVLVISGGNVDSALLFRIVRQVMTRHGRILRFSVLLEDVPGALADLLAIIAEERGNILHILHSPGDGDVPVQVARVNFEIETRGQDHTESILSAIGGAGYTFTAG